MQFDHPNEIERIDSDLITVRQLSGEMTTEAWILSIGLADGREYEGEVVSFDRIDDDTLTIELDASSEFVDIPKAEPEDIDDNSVAWSDQFVDPDNDLEANR